MSNVDNKGNKMENSIYPTKEDLSKMSDTQKTFVRSAKRQGLELRSYSGRGMYGRECPAVVVDCMEDYNTPASLKSKIKWDNMGMGYVIYAAR